MIPNTGSTVCLRLAYSRRPASVRNLSRMANRRGSLITFSGLSRNDGGEGALGCSMVVNPDGHVMAETDQTGQDVVLAEIDAELFYDVRRRTHHCQRYRRPELYGPLADPAFGAKWLA